MDTHWFCYVTLLGLLFASSSVVMVCPVETLWEDTHESTVGNIKKFTFHFKLTIVK